MMNRIHRETLALILVSCLAMAMLLGVGLRASHVAHEAQVSPLQCRYHHLIVAAKTPEVP